MRFFLATSICIDTQQMVHHFSMVPAEYSSPYGGHYITLSKTSPGRLPGDCKDVHCKYLCSTLFFNLILKLVLPCLELPGLSRVTVSFGIDMKCPKRPKGKCEKRCYLKGWCDDWICFFTRTSKLKSWCTFIDPAFNIYGSFKIAPYFGYFHLPNWMEGI